MTDEGVQLVRHIVGNNVSFPRMYHNGKSHRSIEEIREIQREVAGRLETQLKIQHINDKRAQDVLEALKSSDWGDEQSYERFRKVYDDYTGDSLQRAREERDKLFRKK
jgi:hypothetical protein